MIEEGNPDVILAIETVDDNKVKKENHRNAKLVAIILGYCLNLWLVCYVEKVERE